MAARQARGIGGLPGGRLARTAEWLVVLIAAAVAAGLGFRGFELHFAAQGVAVSAWHLAYLTLQLFVLESGSIATAPPWPLEVARFLAPLVAVSAAAKALAVIFRDRLQLAGLRYRRGHVIVCGAGRKGLLMTQEFRRRGDHVAVVELDEEADALDTCRRLGAVVVVGDAARGDTLWRAGLGRAGRLVAVCGDDGCNAQVALEARRLRAGRGSDALACVIHVFDAGLYRLLSERWFAAQQDGAVRLEFFNVFERGARAVLQEHDPLAHPRPHLLVVGLGNFGESLVREAARRWWRRHRGARGRLPISVLDRNAASGTGAVAEQAPFLARTCTLLPVEMEVPSAAFRRGAFLEGSEEAPPVSATYVCFDDDAASLSAAVALSERVGERELPIVIRMEGEMGLASLLSAADGVRPPAAQLRPFGLLQRTCTVDQVLAGTAEVVAQAIHESYRSNRLEEGETPARNPSLRPWRELPRELRESNRRLAVAVSRELALVGCAIEPDRDWEALDLELADGELEALARMRHEWWLAERRRAGYRPGPRREGRRTSPYLVGWEEVPAEERARNRRDVRALSWALGEAGFRIRRAEEAGR